MKVVVAGALFLVALGAAFTAAPAADPAIRAEVVASDLAAAEFLAAERSRISTHLAAVERSLRAADVSHLSPDRRAARAAALDHLREYRQAGVFPHNHDRPRTTPLFRDAHGTLCAMAYLVERSGAGSLVDRVAASANDAYVRELESDAGFAAWLDSNGMTAAEAALVQPAYDHIPGPGVEPGSALLQHYGLVGGTLLAADAVALYLNRPGTGASGPARGIIGLGVGLVSSATALAVLHEEADGPPDALAFANVGFGLVTAAVGAHRLIARSGAPDVSALRLPGGAELNAGPRLIRSTGYRPGVGFSVRF